MTPTPAFTSQEDEMSDDLSHELSKHTYLSRSEVRSALSAIKAAGYAVVPIEPTEEMVVAGDHKIIAVLEDTSFALKEPTVAHLAYTAMVRTALSNPTGSKT